MRLADETPLISFLVPAWNGATHIDAFVACYSALSYPYRELVLCAGGEDDSHAIAARHSGRDVAVLEQQAHEGKQRALRRCYEHSRGQLIFLTDIDCRPDDAAVQSLVRHVLVPAGAVEALTGASCPLPEQMSIPFVAMQWVVDRASEPAGLSASRGLLGRNALLTRAAAEAGGGFRFEARSGTDYALSQELRRAGIPVRFVPGAPMPTEFPATPGDYVRKQARWIRNVFLLGARYGAWRDVCATGLTMLLPLALVGSGLLLLLRSAGRRPSSWLLRAGVVGMATYAILNRLRLQMQAGVRPSPRAAVGHFTATQIAALLAGRDVVARREDW
jgi:cellulose synthase/poly-beta-1,6-N-acetylglucosamine synthase-like glycosyltransferase